MTLAGDNIAQVKRKRVRRMAPADHPHRYVFITVERPACPHCGSANVKRENTRQSTPTTTTKSFRCGSCRWTFIVVEQHTTEENSQPFVHIGQSQKPLL